MDKIWMEMYDAAKAVLKERNAIFNMITNGDMTAVWCAPASSETLVSSGNGFEWRESNGEDQYYTERICNNFYYYEASF